MNDESYKTDEAARRAGIALVTLQRWIASGKAKAPSLVSAMGMLSGFGLRKTWTCS